jgi:hypothetical protein
MPDLDKMVRSKGASEKMVYGTGGKMVYKAISVVALNHAYAHVRYGTYDGANSHPSAPTEDKSDVWPPGLSNWESAVWGGAGSVSVAAANSFWYWYAGTGIRQARFRCYAAANRFDTAAYNGWTLQSITFNVGSYECHDATFYVGCLTQASSSPTADDSWHLGGSLGVIDATGNWTLSCNFTLNDYTFITAFFDEMECPEDRYVTPDYKTNVASVTTHGVSFRMKAP